VTPATDMDRKAAEVYRWDSWTVGQTDTVEHPTVTKYLALLKADSASLTSNYTNIVHFALGAKFIAESLTYL